MSGRKIVSHYCAKVIRRHNGTQIYQTACGMLLPRAYVTSSWRGVTCKACLARRGHLHLITMVGER